MVVHAGSPAGLRGEQHGGVSGRKGGRKALRGLSAVPGEGLREAPGKRGC